MSRKLLDRNAAIFALAERGEKHIVIALTYRMSLSRVSAIVRQEHQRRGITQLTSIERKRNRNAAHAYSRR